MVELTVEAIQHAQRMALSIRNHEIERHFEGYEIYEEMKSTYSKFHIYDNGEYIRSIPVSHFLPKGHTPVSELAQFLKW